MKTRENKVRPGTAARLGAIVLFVLANAALAAAAGMQESHAPSTIDVTGSGSVSTKPDIAIVRLGVQTQDADVQTAVSAAASKMNAVTQAVLSNGVAVEDVQTVDYNIQVRQDQSSRDSSSGDAQPDLQTYYVVQDVALVTVRKIDSLGAVLDAALSAGANRIDNISFSVSDTEGLEKAARERAFADARDRAEQLAALAGVKLGPATEVTESGGQPKAVAMVRSAAFMSAPPVSPGSLSVQVDLHVVFSVQKP